MLIHAHVYFDINKSKQAQQFADQVAAYFKQRIETFPLQLSAAGPHPLPMFTAVFKQSDFQEVSTWIHLHRNNFSVLLHPVIGNQYKAHTVDAVWLGEKLSLHLDRL